jgi:adenylate cyclase
MKLFENYSQGIDTILKGGQISGYSGISNKRSMPTDILKGEPSMRLFAAQNVQLTGDKVLLTFDKNGLEKLFGTNKSSFPNIVIGSHPDFNDVPHDGCCYHHCVSMFVDIKGSTRLGLKHSFLGNSKINKGFNAYSLYSCRQLFWWAHSSITRRRCFRSICSPQQF